MVVLKDFWGTSWSPRKTTKVVMYYSFTLTWFFRDQVLSPCGYFFHHHNPFGQIVNSPWSLGASTCQYMPVCQSVSLPVCQSASLPVCQSASLSVCQSVCKANQNSFVRAWRALLDWSFQSCCNTVFIKKYLMIHIILCRKVDRME